jgi:hypothetical protein
LTMVEDRVVIDAEELVVGRPKAAPVLTTTFGEVREGWREGGRERLNEEVLIRWL